MRTHAQTHACARTRQLHTWPLFTGVRIKEAKSKACKNCFTLRNGLLMFPLENRGVFECSKSKTNETMEGKTAFTWQPYLICITVGVTDGTKKTEKRGEINKVNNLTIMWRKLSDQTWFGSIFVRIRSHGGQINNYHVQLTKRDVSQNNQQYLKKKKSYKWCHSRKPMNCGLFLIRDA